MCDEGKDRFWCGGGRWDFFNWNWAAGQISLRNTGLDDQWPAACSEWRKRSHAMNNLLGRLNLSYSEEKYRAPSTYFSSEFRRGKEMQMTFRIIY